MRVSIEKEHDNFRQTFEIDEDITDVDEDMGKLRVYINVGENPSHFAAIELSRGEIETIFKKFLELKAKVV